MVSGPQGAELCSVLDVAAIAAYKEQYGVNEGKFIRIGSLVVVGPYNQRDHRRSVSHTMLYLAATRSPELAPAAVFEAAMAAAHGERTLDDAGCPTTLSDAGMFAHNAWQDFSKDEVADYEQLRPEIVGKNIVQVYGCSGAFGQADEIGRARTGEIFRENLGDQVFVDVNLW